MQAFNIYYSATEQTATVRSLADIIDDNSGVDLNDSTASGHTCLWYSIQNKDAAASLFVQSTATAASNANIKIPVTDTPYSSALTVVKHDLREVFLRVGVDNHPLSIAVIWG
jgi:hypothetical protein